MMHGELGDEVPQSPATWRARLATQHDALTRLGFAGAIACLGVISCSYCYEIVARYFFTAPTIWADAMVSYALCSMVFLALPELTRKKSHIVLSIMTERLSPSNLVRLQRATRFTAALGCLCAAWFSAGASYTQFDLGIETMSAWAIPKWPLSLIISYGMFSSSIYFLRQASSHEIDTTGVVALS
jgi:TRAP-type C4-dicarboxylate transport system permease small subunit